MNTPYWVLTVLYWLHMLATVTWLGALTALALLVLPAARRTLEPGAYAALLAAIQRRLDPLGWACLAVLAATGMFQMSASPHYQGFLAITDRWAVAMLLKHLAFLLMIALSAWISWGILPGLRRAALRLSEGKASPQIEALHQQEALLVRLNLLLAVVVLLFTALARAA
jgi:uncharacterized membrane protein